MATLQISRNVYFRACAHCLQSDDKLTCYIGSQKHNLLTRFVSTAESDLTPLSELILHGSRHFFHKQKAFWQMYLVHEGNKNPIFQFQANILLSQPNSMNKDQEKLMMPKSIIESLCHVIRFVHWAIGGLCFWLKQFWKIINTFLKIRLVCIFIFFLKS